MTMQEMVTKYNMISAAHRYIVGFVYGTKLYYTMQDGMIEIGMLKADKAAASKGGMNKVRVRLDKLTKHLLVETGKAVLLGEAKMLEADSKYNKGENFERVITEQLTGTSWQKDSVPFYMAGDIELNGVQVQIKLDGAELTNERTLARALALIG